MPGDIVDIAVARTRADESERTRRVIALANQVIGMLPDEDLAVQSVGMMIAVIAHCDFSAGDREQLVLTFMQLIQTLRLQVR